PATNGATPEANAPPLQISGVDVVAAIERTGGNRTRYLRVVRRFAEQQANGVTELRAALAAGDQATAERAAHSLKGSAGNLGITNVQHAAAEAEAAIKGGTLTD